MQNLSIPLTRLLALLVLVFQTALAADSKRPPTIVLISGQ